MPQSSDGVSATLTLMASDVPTASVDRAAGAASDSSAVDLALVRRAQAGDDHAFGQLVERNRRAVYRAAYAALGSAQDADDVAQETFVAVYQKLQGFRGDASFRTWLLAIAWRKALDRRRSLSRWVRMTITHEPARRRRPRAGRAARVGGALPGRDDRRRRPAANAQAAHRRAAPQAPRRDPARRLRRLLVRTDRLDAGHSGRHAEMASIGGAAGVEAQARRQGIRT